MKTKIEIRTVWGKHLFEHEKEDNTIRDTLIEAINKKVDLRGADLRGADLRGADLRGAYLRGEYLRGVDLQGADLRGADLRGVDLRGAYLRGVDLQGAYLRRADLRRADLRGAYLRGVDLQGADLRRAYLRGADLRKIYNQNTILPDGELIVWKKLKGNLIAKLLIPGEAKRVNAIGSRKCRFEFAKVIAIYNGGAEVNTGSGIYDPEFIYEVGQVVKTDKFDDSPLIECSTGIHAFITRQEAEDLN